MSTLRIYDTKGNAYSPDGTATGSDEQIKELFYGGVRLAIRSDHRREISLFFRARESRNARTEQFYAVYSVDNSTAPLQDLISDLTTRIESEWGYTIDESSDEMQVYRELKRGNTAVPGDSTEQDILAELITSRNSVTVGVSDERNAIGLLSEYLGQYDQAAVADSTDADVLSTFDLVVTPGGHRGITPLGETEARWKSTSRSLRDKHIKQEIASIRESVETLSRDYGLSNDEIRNRVQGSVPALKSRTPDSTLRSQSNDSTDDQLLSPELGLYIAVGAVALLVVFAAVFFLQIPSLGQDGGTANSTVEISGTLVDSDGNPIDSSSDVSVALRHQVPASNQSDSVRFEELNRTTSTRFNFTTQEQYLGNLTLLVTADRYENVSQQAEEGSQNITLVAVSGQEGSTEPENTAPVSSRIEGTISNASNEAGIADATVSLTGAETRTTQTTTDGGYAFSNVSRGNYTLSANADGYVGSSSRNIEISRAETRREDFGLNATGSISLRFVSAEDNEVTLNSRPVRLVDAQTDSTIDETTTSGSARYEVSNLAPGDYTVQIYNMSEFEDTSKSFSLSPGETYEETVEVPPNTVSTLAPIAVQRVDRPAV